MHISQLSLQSAKLDKLRSLTEIVKTTKLKLNTSRLAQFFRSNLRPYGLASIARQLETSGVFVYKRAEVLAVLFFLTKKILENSKVYQSLISLIGCMRA